MSFRYLLLGVILFAAFYSIAQKSDLTIEKIMQDPKWIGTSPKNTYWSSDNKLYFNWNPESKESDSLFLVTPVNVIPKKINYNPGNNILKAQNLIYNNKKDKYCYSQKGDLYYAPTSKSMPIRITTTKDQEYALGFIENDTKIAFMSGENIFTWDLKNGSITQMTDIRSGDKPKQKTETNLDAREEVLRAEQLKLFVNLKEQYQKNKQYKDGKKENNIDKLPLAFYYGDKRIYSSSVSSDGRSFAFITSEKRSEGKSTIVPDYVTESGYTQDINAREKVGEKLYNDFLSIYSFDKDSLFNIDISFLPGVKTIPDFYKDYPVVFDSLTKAAKTKKLNFYDIKWSPINGDAIFNVSSTDNKDRWICHYDGKSNLVTSIDHQHDEAWIGGPVVNSGILVWLNKDEICFASEKTGFSHLYRYNFNTKNTNAITSGKYEIQEVFPARDNKSLYLITNQFHPGSQSLIKLDLGSLKQEVMVNEGGGIDEVNFSPDEKYISLLLSKTNQPWELYLKENKSNGKLTRITNLSRSESFNKYSWRDPEIVQFTARDGQQIYARLYKPVIQDKHRPAVIFVHGAGYLQNAHKWWSYYYREYMFHNLLSDLGYTVLDIDYRASAGYGRDVRTGIYRHMGGKDLEDQLDGVNYLIKNHNVSKDNIGIYGGSYGGFITLMALFTAPEVFKAGAALRPVTDWQHYNHGYTSNILNTPAEDSIAYAKSSPINFAEGLVNNLLICHGMIDTNVHFQDVVRLQQRLIDLGKDNWEVAAYPMEGHGFTYPSSWTDEYKRIFKLFEETLRK